MRYSFLCFFHNRLRRFFPCHQLLFHICLVLIFVLIIPSTQRTSPLNNIIHIPLHPPFILPALNIVVLTQCIEFSGIQMVEETIDAFFRSPGTSRFLRVSCSRQALQMRMYFHFLYRIHPTGNEKVDADRRIRVIGSEIVG